MSNAVAAGGASVETELRLMGDDASADEFQMVWKIRNNAMRGMTTYAEQLNRIVDAGKSGSESVGAVADSLTGLASAAQIVIPQAAAVSLAADVGKMLYAHIALVRASKSLAGAMENAQPAIEAIAGILSKDIQDAGEIFMFANDGLYGDLKIENQARILFRKELLAEQDELYRSGLDNLSSQDAARLLEIAELLTGSESWFGPMQRELQSIEKRGAAGRQLFASAAAATVSLRAKRANCHDTLSHRRHTASVARWWASRRASMPSSWMPRISARKHEAGPLQLGTILRSENRHDVPVCQITADLGNHLYCVS